MEKIRTFEEVLQSFGETYLQISGSTDDVDLIEKDHGQLINQAISKIRTIILGCVPEESLPLTGSLEDKYGYLAGQRKGYNQALADIKRRIEEAFK